MTETISVRVPEGTTQKLRLLAWLQSLEQNEEVRWSTLVKKGIFQILEPAVEATNAVHVEMVTREPIQERIAAPRVGQLWAIREATITQLVRIACYTFEEDMTAAFLTSLGLRHSMREYEANWFYMGAFDIWNRLIRLNTRDNEGGKGQ